MRARAQINPSNPQPQGRADAAAYWITIVLVVAVPLAFSTAVYRIYSTPKFVLLLTGAAALVPLLVWSVMYAPQSGHAPMRLLVSRQVLLVILFLLVITISTILGVSPVASLFGSSYNQMGLLTYVSFFILFVSLIVFHGESEQRFRWTAWAMTLTGLAVSTYAVMQFFGRDPFFRSQFYTVESQGGPLLRINSTLGHSDYLGNFLLYVAPLGAGLALGSRGSARRIGFMSAGLSASAIVFSGTRGAWLGLIAATLAFAVLTKSLGKSNFLEKAGRRKSIRLIGIVFVVVLILSAIVAMNPASRTILQRARSLTQEATGSGRTVLWRDAIKMIAEYPLVGCGPEGFRRALLPYKSSDLARLAPETNNESSHNSYIDAAISYGLPGAMLYAGIIASSFALLIGAHKRTTEKASKLILLSFISSLAGVVVHNFFIFDQISTGLYFFAFAAVAQISKNLQPSSAANLSRAARVEGRPDSQTMRKPFPPDQKIEDSTRQSAKRSKGLRFAPLFVAASCVVFFIAAAYSIAIAQADIQISRAFASAVAGDFGGVVEHGNRAIANPDPAGDFSFLFANALVFWADNSAALAGPGQPAGFGPGDLAAKRTQAFSLAMSHAEESLAHSLTSDSNYVLMAYLALRLGEPEKLFAYASEAARRDPNFSNSHWLMAEAYLARGETEPAEREASLALYLNPNSSAGRSALKRARGVSEFADNPQDLIRYGQRLASAGKYEKARRKLLRALRKSGGHCPECHSALASLYEGAEHFQDAILEWQAYALEAPERALREGISARIERLRKQH